MDHKETNYYENVWFWRYANILISFALFYLSLILIGVISLTLNIFHVSNISLLILSQNQILSLYYHHHYYIVTYIIIIT